MIKELGIEAQLLDMYEIKGLEHLVKASAEQGKRLIEISQDSSIKMDPGQRLMLATSGEEKYIDAIKYQQELAKQLKEKNEKVRRVLVMKGEMEAEISQLEEFYKWHTSLERNLGFFDSDYVKRYRFR